MSEFKGTPGPWTGKDIFRGVVLSGEGLSLSCGFASEEVKANGRLALAAPELLQELQRLEVSLNTIKYCYEKRPENMWKALETAEQDCQRAREIIKKALGEA